jgi:hypothetical protein
VLRDVEVQDAPPIVTDDKEAVQHAERNRWYCEEVHRRDRFPKATQRLAVSGCLGAGFILNPRLKT